MKFKPRHVYDVHEQLDDYIEEVRRLEEIVQKKNKQLRKLRDKIICLELEETFCKPLESKFVTTPFTRRYL